MPESPGDNGVAGVFPVRMKGGMGGGAYRCVTVLSMVGGTALLLRGTPTMARYYYAQNREDLLIRAFFPDVAAGTYVDVGANHPVIDSVTKLLYDSGWSGINIEPQTALFEELQRDRPRDLNLNIGVGAEPGRLVFTEFPEANGLSTFDRRVVDRLRTVDRHLMSGAAIERPVEVRTLAAVIRDAQLRHVHVMKVDVEGFEYEALSGMDWNGIRPELLCIEANKIDPVRDWRARLGDAGYTAVFHDGLNEYWLARESRHRREMFDYASAVLPGSPIYYPAAVALEAEIRASLSLESGPAPVEGRKPLHLIFDAQLFQTSDRNRGMGRYALSLIEALDTEGTYCSFIVNSGLPALDTDSRRILEDRGRIVALPLLHAATGLSYGQSCETNRRTVSEAVGNLTARHPSDKSVFVIPALFCGGIHPVFPAEGTANLLVFYDLIPYLFPGVYLQGDHGRDYSERFREFYRADHYACDSQSAADDLTVHLGVDPLRTSAVLGASTLGAHLQPRQPACARSLDRFVLVASGNDPRKNNDAALRAFAAVGRGIRPVLTSRYPAEVENHLRSICPSVLFTGEISDSELVWMIDHAEFVFFPSVYEGLGLPVLEAVDRGVPVVSSRIPSVTEISETAFRLFDPYSIEDMQTALREAVAAPRDRRAPTPAGYAPISERYNWPVCARRFVEAAEKAEPADRNGRVAMLAPAPGAFSAVGRYALQIYAELSRHFDIDYFGETGLPARPAVRFNLLEHGGRYFPAAAFADRAAEYDHVVYHLGNSDFHVTAALTAFFKAGAAIVHDTCLDGLVASAVHAGMVPSELRVQVATVDAALGLSRSRSLAWLVTKQKLIMTFSGYAGAAISEMPLAGVSAEQLNQPVGVPARRVHGGRECSIGFPGIVGTSKGIGLSARIADIPGVAVKVFGFDPWGMSSEIPQHENIRFLGNLTDLQFDRELLSTDVVVNYRSAYHGETSRSTLEAMAVGAVVVVRRIGWFDELPDEAVVKVDTEDDVVRAVADLAVAPERRKRISDAARAFLVQNHGYAANASRLAELIRVSSTKEPPTLIESPLAGVRGGC